MKEIDINNLVKNNELISPIEDNIKIIGIINYIIINKFNFQIIDFTNNNYIFWYIFI